MAEMSAKERLKLQPVSFLWPQYDPARASEAFHAESLREAETWQERTRRLLVDTVGFQDTPRVGLQPKMLGKKDKGDYVREKVLLRTSADSVMPVYVLTPKKAPRPLPVVLALHGHGYGAKDIVGLWEDGSERDTPEGYHSDFAVALCRRGFAVAAPEIAGFGERQTDFSYLGKFGGGAPTTCMHAATLAFHLGGSAIGMRVLEARRLVDYLESRRDLDVDRLGAMGISGGGTHTFFSSCLDTRIRACVISGYYCSWRKSIFAMHHCPCNYVPGLHRFGEIYDLVGLIAPRPLLVEAGDHDNIFPMDGVREAVAKGRKVYGIWKAAEALETDYFEGRHSIHGRRAYNFLWEKLAAPAL